MKKNLLESKITIFIFDSGLGGVTILKYIKEVFFNVNFIYLLDNKYFPYGNKSQHFILQRLIQILKKISYYYNISLAIIACNTASVSSFPQIKKYFNFPILGIFPVINLAIKNTQNKIIGLLATDTTLKNLQIKKKIKFFSKNYTIETLSSKKLVFLAEKKLLGYKLILNEIKKIFVSWFNLTKFPDTIILGCTHFPLIINELKVILPKNIKFVDSKKDIIINLINLEKKIKFVSNQKQNIVFYTQQNSYIKKTKLYFLNNGFNSFQEIKI
ncbi:glutamate racemase [Enterobacteriaceae endosymbiont of Donacia tomentosa]|uniref:glutamate racemase n=1 Tax=Enterobacteriaceae endosymbiont of Donacia tomentosa TaxID=2675787 RepID=UPI001448B7DE|nr:glutamate racemase [Enterobacteriaceae endosymbiont of Donacia tomentosa]QJC31776.1 glutamate racemase [Enterobacteriaceae endosymbiont of Donacia tomentosa]